MKSCTQKVYPQVLVVRLKSITFRQCQSKIPPVIYVRTKDTIKVLVQIQYLLSNEFVQIHIPTY